MKTQPVIRYATGGVEVKAEDLVFCCEQLNVGDSEDRASPWALFCVCDGHNGVQCARFVERRLERELQKRLPVTIPDDFESEDGSRFCSQVTWALVGALESIDDEWRSLGEMSGTTVTIALIIGWLVTVANVGDSDAYLHCWGEVGSMTHSHRLEVNETEEDRLKCAGVFLAGAPLHGGTPTPSDCTYGPLRAWPGGLTLSRTLGDIDAPAELLARPHVKQAVVPKTGGRLLIASDGLWDHLNGEKAIKSIKHKPIDQGPDKIIEVAQTAAGGIFKDDTTVLVVDVIPVELIEAPAPRHPLKDKLTKLRSVITPKKRNLEDPEWMISSVDTLDVFPMSTVHTMDDTAHGVDGKLCKFDSTSDYPSYAEVQKSQTAAISNFSRKDSVQEEYSGHMYKENKA